MRSLRKVLIGFVEVASGNRATRGTMMVWHKGNVLAPLTFILLHLVIYDFSVGVARVSAGRHSSCITSADSLGGSLR